MKASRLVINIGAVGLALLLSSRSVKAATPPLPTLEDILPRMVARAQQDLENDRAFESRFIFVISRLTETRNAKGEIKKREETISTNNPALKKLIAPPAAAARVPEQTPPVTDSPPKGRGRADEEDSIVVNEDLVKRFEFMLVGREMLNGRPALVVDFVPAKGKAPQRHLKDKFINRTVGRVWLDEEDYTMAKVALHLTDRVKVLGGLVGAVWKFNFDLERKRTAEGLWYSRDVTWHLEGREVFVNRTVDYHEERTGVRQAP